MLKFFSVRWFFRLFLTAQALGLLLTFFPNGAHDEIIFAGLAMLFPGSLVTAVAFWNAHTSTSTFYLMGSILAMTVNLATWGLIWFALYGITLYAQALRGNSKTKFQENS